MWSERGRERVQRETWKTRKQGAKMAGLHGRKEKLGKGSAAQRLERLREGGMV